MQRFTRNGTALLRAVPVVESPERVAELLGRHAAARAAVMGDCQPPPVCRICRCPVDSHALSCPSRWYR